MNATHFTKHTVMLILKFYTVNCWIKFIWSVILPIQNEKLDEPCKKLLDNLRKTMQKKSYVSKLFYL